MTSIEQFICSHPGCRERLPGSHLGREIPPGWTVAKVEEHAKDNIVVYYLYLCPRHAISSTERQIPLFA